MDAFVNDPNAAEPHRMVRGNWRTTTTNPAYYSVAPASGINASIFDMTMWVRANLGAFPDVMSPVFLSNLHTPIIDTPHGNYFNRWSGIEKAYYATGWRVFDYRGLRVVHHGGGVRGFRSEMVFVPDGNIGMVLLFNAESNLANDDLTWETTDQFNFGIDLSLFKSKLNFTIDAYHKLTHDLLQNVQLPPSNGYASRVDNFGEVENKGIDFNVNTDLVTSQDFSWNINANFGLNKNKLKKLNSNLDFQLGPSVGFSQAYPILFKVGEPLGIYWGAETDGIYADWEEALSSGISGAAPGEIKYINHYVDLDESGNPAELQEINFDDYVKIGDPNPDFTFSFTNNFSYKKWDASILFTGQKGGDIFWVDSWQLSGLQKTTNVLTSSFNESWIAPISYENGSYVYDSSIGNLTNASHPAAILDTGSRAISSDRNIFDGSFLRLKNINIGYTFDFRDGKNMRVYFSGQNLVVWTDYPGYDPEVRTYTKNPQKRGVDFGTYPGTKTYLLGLKFNY